MCLSHRMTGALTDAWAAAKRLCDDQPVSHVLASSPHALPSCLPPYGICLSQAELVALEAGCPPSEQPLTESPSEEVSRSSFTVRSSQPGSMCRSSACMPSQLTATLLLHSLTRPPACRLPRVTLRSLLHASTPWGCGARCACCRGGTCSPPCGTPCSCSCSSAPCSSSACWSEDSTTTSTAAPAAYRTESVSARG